MQHFLSHFFSRRNLVVIGVLTLLAVGVWQLGQMDAVNELVRHVFAVVASYDQRIAAAIFIVLAMFSAMLTFFISVPLVPLALALWGAPLTFTFLLGGWLLGGMAAYGIGRVAAHLLAHLRSFKKIESYRNQLDGVTQFTIVLLFRLAVPAEIASYTLGMLRYSFIKSVCAVLLSDAPFAFLALYSTAALFHSDPLTFVGAMFIGMLAMSGALYFLYKKLRKPIPSEHAKQFLHL